MGFIFISLGVICSLSIAHILKLASKAKQRTLNTLFVNYVTASLFSFLVSGNSFNKIIELESHFLIIAFILGAIFILNLIVYSLSLEKNGMGISITAMRLSLVVPIAVSILIYGEHIYGLGIVGIVLVLVSLFLITPRNKDKKASKFSISFYPIALFLMTGVADSILKIFERELRSIASEFTFLGLIFFSSSILSAVYLIHKKEFSFIKKEFFLGICLGIFNLYSSYFLLKALTFLDGTIVFSISNISNVLFGSIIGFIVWGDKLERTQKVGLIIASLSILLLINP